MTLGERLEYESRQAFQRSQPAWWRAYCTKAGAVRRQAWWIFVLSCVVSGSLLAFSAWTVYRGMQRADHQRQILVLMEQALTARRCLEFPKWCATEQAEQLGRKLNIVGRGDWAPLGGKGK